MQKVLLLILCGLALAGCDQLGIESPAQLAAVKDAEGRAIGGACRHSGRALEDCYVLNPKAQKAAVFGGWRDMDAYMRENNIEVVPAVIPRPDAAAKKKKTEEAPAEAPAKDPAAHSALDNPAPMPSGRGRMV